MYMKGVDWLFSLAHGGSQPGQNKIPIELEKLLKQFIY